MAFTSNGVDTTELINAIQEYAKACVIEAKLPRYAESRRIDAIRATRLARNNYMREIHKVTLAAANITSNLEVCVDA